MDEIEKQPLIQSSQKEQIVSPDFDSKNTESRSCGQKVAFLALLLLQFCHLCTDSLLIPFFPNEALTKGLTHVHLGVVYSAYEFTRFLSAPIFGSLVS